MATITDVENGMVEYFLGKPAITDLIGQRFYKLACEQWILTRDDLMKLDSRTARWADYRRAGRQVNGLLGGLSKMPFATFEISCYGQVMENAEALLESFIAALGERTRFDGTWGTAPAVTIKGAHWLYEAESSEYDDSVGQAKASIGIMVPYRSA